MATNSDPIEQESFVYTSTTRTTKTTSSSTTQRQHSSAAAARKDRSGSGGGGSGGKGRYRFRDSSLPRSAESGNTAPSSSSPFAPPWSWFRSSNTTMLGDSQSQQQQQQKQTMSGSTDRVNDSVLTSYEELKGASSAGNSRQQQQEQSQQQASVVRQNQQQRQQGKRVSLSQNDLQQQQQHLARQYHDNNSNASNNNGSKVRLLITPASTPTTPPMNAMTATKTTPTKQKYGNNSEQAQMVRSATATFATINSLPEQQLRSHSVSQQQLQQQQNSQRNYHHYDYYTDSDLASSLLLASQPAGSSNSNAAANHNSSNNYNQNGSHYDENLLLFATEHNTNYNQRTNGNKQQPQVSHLLHGGGNPGAGGSNRNLHGVMPTGKFVNSYPLWRQTQSSATGHHQNYSFHVPTSQPPMPSQQHHHQQQPIYHQPRYGFVAPASNSSGGGRFNNSHRSRTIGNLPGMVKVSAEDSCNNLGNTPTGDDGGNRICSSALATSTKERTQQFSRNGNEGAIDSRVDSSTNYEDFYEKPTISSMKHMIMSEGDLLRVHVGDYKSAPFSAADYGFDNPFRPGTELSWEADMMVRLMKRGYPVKELPVLVETAKQVAREIGSPTHSQVDESQAIRTRNGSGGSTSALASRGSETSSNNGNKQQVPSKHRQQETLQGQQFKQTTEGASSETFNDRRQSSLDLRSGKQIWANNLNRAKSMPRFYPPQADADSIDKLITSIENEMSDLLQHDNEGADDDNRHRLRRRKSSGDRATTYAVGDYVDDSDNGTSGRPPSSLAIITKVPSGSSKTKNKMRAAPQEKQQMAVKGNRKEIVGARKQQQQRRKSSSGSGANSNQDKGDLKNKISRKHKRDFECCMIQ